jgi:hypothetical protein
MNPAWQIISRSLRELTPSRPPELFDGACGEPPGPLAETGEARSDCERYCLLGSLVVTPDIFAGKGSNTRFEVSLLKRRVIIHCATI